MSSFAIVLAAFGVANASALAALGQIQARFQGAFPDAPVRLAFTSNQIRKIWRRRARDPQWREANPSVPPDILEVQGPLAVIANLQDAGYRDLVVQSLHIYAGEEYRDLRSYLDGLNAIRTVQPRWMPFSRALHGASCPVQCSPAGKRWESADAYEFLEPPQGTS
ncbi:MAG: sirohydrochlorin cobaltochelatase [Deltaproteobacteria bacterium]|nr:sirohydrochlorin cobaltochelatase [Deltaproteobacteria bacterium]